jgi:hypothetical protein
MQSKYDTILRSSLLGLAGVGSLLIACGPPPPTTTGAGGSGGSTGAAWCDVSKILQTNCSNCHGATPQFGAPMSLVTVADLTATRNGVKVFTSVLDRIQRTDASRMPYNAPPLPSQDIDTIKNWVSAGTPGPIGQCSSGTGGTGGTGYVPDPANDADWPCPNGRKVRLTSHNAFSTAKFTVPNPTDNRYICANFNTPFRPGETATYIRPLVDDKRVIHHFILFGQATAGGADGSISEACVTPNLFGTQVGGWAPGGGGGIFPDDVGMKLDYPYLQLQVHYNNGVNGSPGYNDAADASGLEFCATTQPKPNVAGVVTLGVDSFSIPAGAQNYPIVGSCPNLSRTGNPITIIGTSPHMHVIGTSFTTTHAGHPNLIDILPGKWAFDSQIQYPVDRRVVMPNEALTTTCRYNNPNPYAVNFGTKTTDEMCFNFITAYPIDETNKKCGQGITFF